MKQKEKGQQLNKNAGFSLLELLIAVTILAIITIPMLHMFVTSARINGKSRITLRATVLAQDIVEGLKAYHIDEIQDQFNTKHLDMLNSTITCEECKYDDDGSNVYYFYLKNVKLENSTFDAKIKLDASAYIDGTSEAGKHDMHPNTSETVRLASANRNASFVYKKNWDETALKDKNIDDCARTFILSFTDDVTTGKRVATLKCEYQNNGTDIVPPAYSDFTTIGEFDSNNFYFLYYPLYGGKDDIIEIDCTSTAITEEHPLNIYLVKQRDVMLSDIQLTNKENLYKITVTVKGDEISSGYFSLCTNLGTNLADENMVIDQAPGLRSVSFPVYDLAGIRNKNYGEQSSKDQITEFIYDIEVEIYQQGAYEDNFGTNSQRLVSLDGTKNY